jgi:hypothetical protein
MIELDSTLDLEVFLGGAITTNELTFYCSYVDINNTTRAIAAIGFYRGVTTGATPVVACAAPDVSDDVTRQVKLLIVRNKDTVDATVTVQTASATTDTPIQRKTLATTESLQVG